MVLQKISLNFQKYTDADFLNKAGHILTSMTNNSFFSDPIPPLTVLSAAVARYGSALLAAENLGKTNIAEKNQAREDLEGILVQLGMYVMYAANGSVPVLTSSGYSLTKMREPRYISNPGNVTLTNGVTSGQMEAFVKGVKVADHFLHQITDTLPTEITVWTSTPSSKSKFVFTGLTPGKQYWVRIAVVGTGEQIAYSTIATQFAQ